MSHVRITTGKQGKTPRGAININAADLPNPYAEPWLRPRDGRDPKVQSWIFNQPGVGDQLANYLEQIETRRPATISVTCSAGRHRSVAVGEWLTTQLRAQGWDVQLEHRALTAKKQTTTTARGYGWKHQKQRDRLLYNHQDGTPCWWCGLPMYRNKNQNWDQKPLAADHTNPNGAKNNQLANQLLHGHCNSQAQDHKNDHLRPALTGRHPSQPLPKTPPTPTTNIFTWG